jgi:UDP-N-acetylglucosamine 2-epimerase (non-hydrolysing)
MSFTVGIPLDDPAAEVAVVVRCGCGPHCGRQVGLAYVHTSLIDPHDAPLLTLVNDLGLPASEHPQGLQRQFVPADFQGMAEIFSCPGPQQSRSQLPFTVFKEPYERFIASGRQSVSELMPSTAIDVVDAGSSTVTMVCGTRPELIKLAPLIRCFGTKASVIYTGQHYDQSMYSRIWRDIPQPGRFHEFALGGTRRGTQLGRAVAAVDSVLSGHPTGAVLVQGDTTSALAGALAANANELPVVHVEAGLRSYDRMMPEEHNRVLIDHLADLCCAPTTLNRENLLSEGIPVGRIEVTGNTVVEALAAALPGAEQQRAVLASHGLLVDGYILATIHRPENVDNPETLEMILRELARLPLPVVFPLHPRTGRRIKEFGMTELVHGLRVIEPQAYPAFLAITRCAAAVVSDSGGLQEEVSVLKRPIVVVRRSTERPEIEGTFGTLIPPGPLLYAAVLQWLDDVSGHRTRLRDIPSPYEVEASSTRIASAVQRLVSQRPGRPTDRIPAGTVLSPAR